jgi:hypothetical protein
LVDKLEKFRNFLEHYFKQDTNIISSVVIEADNKIVDSSGSSGFINEIELINSAWIKNDAREITLSGLKYVILQSSVNVFIAITPDNKGSIIGAKDEERKIFYKIAPNGLILKGLKEASRTLSKLSSRDPYMSPDDLLGKTEGLKWTTPRILLDDTNNLQELGLLKFGLSIEEAKVYLALLNRGREGTSVGKLNEDLAIKRTTIYRIIDRLISKEWVVKLPLMPKSAQNYIARPLNDILDERIQQKDEELKILKSFRYIMGESSENGWIILSDIKKDLQTYGQETFDFKTLGITGVEKDCGLLIFEYDKEIKENIIIRAALQLSLEKMRELIQPDLEEKEFTILDLKDVKTEDTQIKNYLGMTLYFKFKEGTETGNNVGTDWIIAARFVAVPIEGKIYVVWGSEEKFLILLSIILKL